jgi:GTP-binding protein
VTFSVAIVGRPNVGKSTLFNRLVGRKAALVHNTPGVTRDRRQGKGRIADLEFQLIDTAGLDEAAEDVLEGRMMAQTERAVEEADATMLLIDARQGVTPTDEHFARWLRRHETPVILVANKCDGSGYEAGLLDAYGLGLGDPVPVSAEHGDGLADLYEVLAPFRDGGKTAGENDGEDPDFESFEEKADGGEEETAGRPLSLAIVGRPNVGKSTLANQLLGEERLLTGPDPGVTRDAIAVDWEYRGHAMRLVDTAGLRRRARVVEKLERMSVEDTLRAVRFAHVVVLVVDATQIKDIGAAIEKQDLGIAGMAVEEGRALVIAVNKWDAVGNRRDVLKRLGDSLERSLPQVKGVKLVPISALRGSGLDALMAAVIEAERLWNTRLPTATLNRWLAGMAESHPPPLDRGRRVRLRYITEIKSRPPTFALFVNKPAAIRESYLRYLVNGLRDTFDLPGVPIRMLPRKGKNPYVKE